MPSRKSSMKSGERSFTIEMVLMLTVAQLNSVEKILVEDMSLELHQEAASKALTQLCNVKKVRGQCTLFVKMRETTQGSKKKEFLYNVKREKLNNPVELSGRTLEYKNRVKSTDSMPNCKKSHKSSGRMRKQHTRTRTSSSRKSSSRSRSTKKSSGSFLGLL